MLVLTRKIGQRIVIADRIVVTVLECGGGRVRLGIEAPREVNVVREELESQFHVDTKLPAGKVPPKG